MMLGPSESMLFLNAVPSLSMSRRSVRFVASAFGTGAAGIWCPVLDFTPQEGYKKNERRFSTDQYCLKA